MASYTLSAKITGDSKSYENALDKAKTSTENLKKPLEDVKKPLEETEHQLPRTESKFEQFGSKLENIGSRMQDVGAKMTVGLTLPLAIAGKKAVEAASDYQENLNKVDVAFGNSSNSVTAWANNALKQFGLSKNQALEASSLFGDMATSMGLSQPAAASMSTSLTGLAGDLASFKNMSVEEAMTALNGVFTGETESLKRLGVVMTDAELNAYALEKGMGKTTSQMSQAEKVQLRYNFVMDKTKNAHGDYARTSEGTANSMRTFQGTVDNLMITLGEKLLPVFTPLIQGATGLIEKFAGADPAVQGVVVGALALVAVGGPLLIFFGSAARGISSMISLYSRLKNSQVLTTIATKAQTVATKLCNAAIGAGKAIVTGVKTAFLALKNAHILSKVSTVAMTVATTVWNTVGTVATAVTSALGAAFVFLTSPIGLVILAIAAVIAIGYLLVTHWDTLKATAISVWNYLTGIFVKFDSFLTGIFATDWTESFGAFGNIMNAFCANASNIWNAIKQVFQGVIDFVGGVFSGDWGKAWDGIVGIFSGVFNGIVAIAKAPINLVIGLVNGMVAGVESGINFLIDCLNTLSFKVPKWVPVIGGEKWGFDFGHVNLGRIQQLRSGTDNWQGGFARMNEGGRGELAYLPNGSQVIPHDISVKYAQEAARVNSTVSAAEFDVSALGDYIVAAISSQGQQIAEGISNIKMVSNNRETARFIADLGFRKG